jgi:hypothetical protein
MKDRVRIFNQSCPGLADLLSRLQHRPARLLGIRGIGGSVDARYAAIVWKNLFVIALKRMGRRQQTLARVTAVEALKILSLVSTSSKFPARGGLSAIRHRSYSTGQLKPHTGLHPDVMVQRYWEAMTVVRGKEIRREELIALWRTWKAGKVPTDLESDLAHFRGPHARAVCLLTKAFDYVDEESVQTLLSRARKHTRFLLPPPSSKPSGR